MKTVFSRLPAAHTKVAKTPTPRPRWPQPAVWRGVSPDPQEDWRLRCYLEPRQRGLPIRSA